MIKMHTSKRSRSTTQDSTTKLLNDLPPGCVGVRHLQVLLLFLCLVFAYIIRVNISVAIVAITRDTTDTDKGVGDIYSWSPSTKSVILSAFFWGYLIMNLPAAVIGHKVNNKWLLGCSFAVASILSILTPPLLALAPDHSSVIMVVIRVCQGLSQSFMLPMTHGLLSRWAPPGERTRFATFVLVGQNFGSMLVLACSGMLASTTWGWPSIFYFSGGLGLIWNSLLLGDSGYGLKPYLMTPFLNPTTEAEERFNESHIAARNTVERCYGVWKRRFPAISLGLRTSLPTSLLIIVATAVLHNIAVQTKDIVPPDDEELHNYLTQQRLKNPQYLIFDEVPVPNIDVNRVVPGTNVRNMIVQNHFV